MVLALDNQCSSKQGALGMNTGAGPLPKNICHPFWGAECSRFSNGDAGTTCQMASVPQNCPRHPESAGIKAAHQSQCSEQKCAGCSAQGHHVPFSCCLPTSTRHCRRDPTEGSSGEKGALCLGTPGTVNSVPLTLNPRLFLAAYRVAIGRVLSHEESSQERNKFCCSGTGLPASCWHPDLRPQQIIQSPVDRELTDLGQKGSELI